METVNTLSQDPGAVGAKVVAMSDLSSSVKSLTLRSWKCGNVQNGVVCFRLDTPGTTFEAGQWLDFFIPGEEKVHNIAPLITF